LKAGGFLEDREKNIWTSDHPARQIGEGRWESYEMVIAGHVALADRGIALTANLKDP